MLRSCCFFPCLWVSQEHKTVPLIVDFLELASEVSVTIQILIQLVFHLRVMVPMGLTSLMAAWHQWQSKQSLLQQLTILQQYPDEVSLLVECSRHVPAAVYSGITCKAVTMPPCLFK